MMDKVNLDENLQVVQNGEQTGVPAGVKNLQNQDAIVMVNRTWPPDQRQVKIGIRPFVTEVAKVSVAKGLTINAGNYNSIRVDVVVSLPCYLEEINETYQYAKQLTEHWIKSEEAFINQELKKQYS